MRRILLMAVLLTASLYAAAPAPYTSAAAKVFNVTARTFQFDFSPSPFVVNQGDSVTLNITVPANDASAFGHGFFLEQYVTSSISIAPGQTVPVSFIANVPGTFAFACTVSCGIGHGGMNGTLIVHAVEPLPAPSLSSFNPTSGPTAGGTVVAITGANFQNGAAARFGDTPAVTTIVNSATSITVINPARPAGAVKITITNPDGQSATSAASFSYGTQRVTRRRAVRR